MEEAAVYPGQRLGLPESGSGSIAPWGRRIAALLIDWMASWLVALFIFREEATQGGGQFIPLGVFIIESAFLIALAGGSFGQLAVRIAVGGLGGRPINLLQALARQLLVACVIPPLVFNRDNRGLHDMAARTVVIKR